MGPSDGALSTAPAAASTVTRLAREGALCYLRCVRPLHLPAALLFTVTATLAPAAALAHGGGAAMPSEVPPAPPGDGTSAQALVRDLEARAATDAETARVTAEPIKNAKRALERAQGARMAGDDLHARMLWGLALEWAEAARDFDRAAAAERTAQTASKAAYQVQTEAERARALLEETQARRGRTLAELTRVEADAKESAGSAADAEKRRIEAAKKKTGGAPREGAPREGAPREKEKKTPPAPPKKGAK
jgi:hypothetical protein